MGAEVEQYRQWEMDVGECGAVQAHVSDGGEGAEEEEGNLLDSFV